MAASSYDEDLVPGTDPPVIEPPPPATALRRIFAYRRPPRTVVEAPLRELRLPPAGEAPTAGAPQAAGPAAAPAAPIATRYCATCGKRGPVAADGQHCADGHRLSPAHRRRWSFGRLSRR